MRSALGSAHYSSPSAPLPSKKKKKPVLIKNDNNNEKPESRLAREREPQAVICAIFHARKGNVTSCPLGIISITSKEIREGPKICHQNLTARDKGPVGCGPLASVPARVTSLTRGGVRLWVC